MNTTRHVLTVLAVSDVERSARFYAEAFGWPTAVDEPVYVELALPGGGRLGLYAERGFAANTGARPVLPPPGALSPVELYLHCGDLDAAEAALERAGARLLAARSDKPWGDAATYFADPDGHVLVVARPRE
jgi:predicted enzyme related to lactoylglutathione lyase